MRWKCQEDDNVSSSDQISHGLTSSVSDNKKSKRILEGAEYSTVSSERAHSANHSYPHKQRKVDSSSSKNSNATIGQLSSVDSVGSKNVSQDSKHSCKRSSHFGFDLNEEIETDGLNWHPESEPIPVVAKMGVPIGVPKKPLLFGGNLGWKSSGITCAFNPTRKKPDKENARVPRMLDFDLNVAATTDPEVLTDPAPVLEGASKSIDPQGISRQRLLPSGYGSNAVSYTPNYPYWVDLSSVREFGNVQGQAFLMSGPNTVNQVQMVVPIQLPYTPPGLYMGKMNGLSPIVYPGNAGLLECSQGLSMNLTLNPHPYANMRQAFLSNGSVVLMENGSRAGNSLYDQRMTAVEQMACPGSAMKRQ